MRYCFGMARFLVVGLGNFGSTAALSLSEQGHEVVALDLDAGKVEELSDRIREVAVGDGTEVEVLRTMDAHEAEGAIISTGQDVTASVLTAITLRDLGIRDIYVKIVSDLHARVLGKVGVTETVFPEKESAVYLARRVGDRAILRYVELGPGLSVQEMAVPGSWVGSSLRKLELPRRYGISVIAVRDYLSGETRPVPDPDSPLKDSDTLLVAGSDQDLRRVAEI